MSASEDFRQYQHDPTDFVPEPPEHRIDDERSASGENIDPEEDYPFSGYV